MSSAAKAPQFKMLMDYIKKLHSRYFRALTAFYAYESMKELSTPDVVGQTEAHENILIMNRYKNFFVISQEALRVYFFLELAKLFDNSKKSLHINKIINFTAKEIKYLNVNAFKEYNEGQDRKFLEELSEKYKGVSASDLVEVKNMLEKQKQQIKKLEIYRNKWVAHDELNKPEPPAINVTEIKDLFITLAKILNMIAKRLNAETWMYSHVEDNIKHDIRLLLEDLRQHKEK